MKFFGIINPQGFGRKGPYTPDAIRQCDAIFRFSLTDNFDSSLNSKFALIGCFINFQKLKNRVALSNRVRCVWTLKDIGNKKLV